MESVNWSPKDLWQVFKQAHPNSVEFAGYSFFDANIPPNFQYLAQDKDDTFFLDINQFGNYPSDAEMMNDVSDNVLKRNGVEPRVYQPLFLRRFEKEIKDEFEKKKIYMPKYIERKKISQKWYDAIITKMVSLSKPLDSSIPLALLKVNKEKNNDEKKRHFSLPLSGYVEWITHNNFSKMLEKLKMPAACFSDIGKEMWYDIKISGFETDSSLSKSVVELGYCDSVYKLSIQREGGKKKELDFSLNVLGKLIPSKKPNQKNK